MKVSDLFETDEWENSPASLINLWNKQAAACNEFRVKATAYNLMYDARDMDVWAPDSFNMAQMMKDIRIRGYVSLINPLRYVIKTKNNYINAGGKYYEKPTK